MAFLFLLFSFSSSQAQLDQVVATVDRTLVTRQDLRYYVMEARLYEPELWSVPDEVLEKQVLTDVVHEQALYRHLWKEGREPGEAEVKQAADNAWKRLVALAGSQTQLDAVLKRSELKTADVKRWLEERARRLWVVEGEIANRLNPSLFNREEPSADQASEVQLAQIFVKSFDHTSEDEWRAAQQRVLKIKGDIERGVMSFDEAAALFSDDGLTARSGGLIGWSEPQHLDSSVLEGIRPLKVGDVSAPIRSKEGWHLFRLMDMDTPRRRELRESSQKLKQELLAKLRREMDIIVAEGYELQDPAKLESTPQANFTGSAADGSAPPMQAAPSQP